METLHLLWWLAPCVHHHWAYPEILCLLWQCDSSSSLSQSSLSSLLQLQTSTLFHLSIVSMMSLHSTGSYLKTLHLLWRSPSSSSSSLVADFNHFVLAVTTSQLWLLWLLSPFLHVTSGCDLGPNFTRVLPELCPDLLIQIFLFLHRLKSAIK
jgi:hypothetical protein